MFDFYPKIKNDDKEFDRQQYIHKILCDASLKDNSIIK
mgnify:CR=1 FL=1